MQFQTCGFYPLANEQLGKPSSETSLASVSIALLQNWEGGPKALIFSFLMH